MKYNSKLIRQRNNFAEAMRQESTLYKQRDHQSDTLDYTSTSAYMPSSMDHATQHGEVRVIMRDGKLVSSKIGED